MSQEFFLDFMFFGAPTNRLPQLPKLTKFSSKLALGVVLIFFFLDYQPALQFPPIIRAQARAQVEQIQQIHSQSLPIKFQLPHPGYLSTSYGFYHPGIDIATGIGMPIHPLAKGVVKEAYFNFWGLGLTVEIEHGFGFRSLYAHLGKIYVTKGQAVEAVDSLGIVGLTGHTSGPHTHLEITKDSDYINPVTLLPTIRDYPQEEDFQPVTQVKVSDRLNIKKELTENL